MFRESKIRGAAHFWSSGFERVKREEAAPFPGSPSIIRYADMCTPHPPARKIYGAGKTVYLTRAPSRSLDGYGPYHPIIAPWVIVYTRLAKVNGCSSKTFVSLLLDGVFTRLNGLIGCKVTVRSSILGHGRQNESGQC